MGGVLTYRSNQEISPVKKRQQLAARAAEDRERQLRLEKRTEAELAHEAEVAARHERIRTAKQDRRKGAAASAVGSRIVPGQPGAQDDSSRLGGV